MTNSKHKEILMVKKTIPAAAIAILTLLAASRATSSQIFSEPDKDQTRLAYAIYDAKCPPHKT